MLLLASLLVLSLVRDALAQDSDSGGSEAGDGGPLVAITQVESEAFPQVTAFVVVSGEDGLPLGGLRASHFTLVENGDEVPASSITVEEDTTQGFSLVLALDVSSTEPDTLVQVQEAIKSFLDTLEPQDQVAIVAFYNEVQVVQDFTDSQRVLNAAINALGTQGDRSALNQAILECAALAGVPPLGRGAVVVFANSADNVRGVSMVEAVEQARASRVPVYAIGFGSKIRADDLQELSDLTGEPVLILADPDEMGDRLQEIKESLRQGYRVVFQSELQADDTEHDFSIGVTYQDQAGQAQGHFVAHLGEVTVSLPDLADGQTVGGVVKLSAQVTDTAPAPTIAVEYLLDDRSLGDAVVAPPYSLDWDSTTVEPGVYVLTARAVDSAGNEGQAEVSLNVVLPLVVTLSTPQEAVELGELVTIEAQVEALAEVEQVEFLLDGDSLGSDSVAPFRFSFDSGVHVSGEHTLTARAQDDLGREQDASLSVAFVAPPPPPTPKPPPEPEPSPSRNWLLIPAVVVVLAIAIASGVALVTLLRLQRERNRISYSLEISNLGNVRSRYELQAEEPSGDLSFEFALDGDSLHQRQVASGEKVAPVDSQASLEGVKQAADKGRGVSRTLANWAASAASFLPRSIREPVLRTSGQVRRGEQKVSQVEGASRRRVTQAEALVPSSQEAGPAAPASPAAVRAWAQTPFVEPGETLTVDLRIDPARPYHTQHYPFTVLSRSVEQEDAPLVVEETGVQIVRPSWLRRYYPFLIVLAVMAVTSILFVVFLISAGIWS